MGTNSAYDRLGVIIVLEEWDAGGITGITVGIEEFRMLCQRGGYPTTGATIEGGCCTRKGGDWEGLQERV